MLSAVDLRFVTSPGSAREGPCGQTSLPKQPVLNGLGGTLGPISIRHGGAFGASVLNRPDGVCTPSWWRDQDKPVQKSMKECSNWVETRKTSGRRWWRHGNEREQGTATSAEHGGSNSIVRRSGSVRFPSEGTH